MSAPELMRLVYRNKKTPALSANDIPTLIPESAMNALLNGDDNPYYKVEAIDYPATGTGGVYEGDFFKSFINKLKDTPFPGSKRGHENASRPSSDFYTVGGKVVPKDENSGTAYLKMYIPKDGDTTSNSGFIRDAKAGIVNFSLVTWPEYNMQDDGKGNMIRHFTASKGYERNDAVELGAGAMDQTVNSAFAEEEEYNQTGPVDAFRNFHSARVRDPGDFKKDGAWANKTIDEAKGIQIVVGQLKNPPSGQAGSMVAQAYRFPITKFSPEEAKKWCADHKIKFIKFTVGKDYKAKSFDYETAKKLVENGKYKKTGVSSGEIVQNGFVMRPVLRAMLSHADVENKEELAELVSLIDKHGGRKNMDEELEVVKNGLDNGAININAVAEKLGIKNKLRTEADEKNAATVTELAKQFNCKPEELTATLVNIKNAQEAANKATVENAVIKAFGAATVKNGKGEEEKNLAYVRAMELCNGKSGTELDTAIKNAAEDDYIKAFRSQMADVNSEINVVETNGTKPDELNQNGAFML